MGLSATATGKILCARHSDGDVDMEVRYLEIPISYLSI